MPEALDAEKKHPVTQNIKEEILYMVTCVFSPSQFKSRYNRYFQFAEYISKFKNVYLYTIELAIGNQEFTVTDPHNSRHMQIRSDHPLWYKENLLNMLIHSLPSEAQKIAVVDCDVQWDDDNWVQYTLDALNQYPVVQMFETWQNLDEYDQPTMAPTRSFANRWVNKTQKPNDNGFTGLAWAYQRNILKQIGGLIDWGILGSGDYYMAYGFVGKNRSDAGGIDANKEPDLKNYLNQLDESLNEWIARANKYVKKNIGYIKVNIRHFFHGKKTERGYNWRWKILVDFDYKPSRDIGYREDGLIYLKNPHPEFFNRVQYYFDSRQEDSPHNKDVPIIQTPIAAE